MRGAWHASHRCPALLDAIAGVLKFLWPEHYWSGRICLQHEDFSVAELSFIMCGAHEILFQQMYYITTLLDATSRQRLKSRVAPSL